MESFTKKLTALVKPLTFVEKLSILDACGGSGSDTKDFKDFGSRYLIMDQVTFVEDSL